MNLPYCGSLVPMRFFRKEPLVWSIMVEVRWGLYMDETNGNKAETFRSIRSLLDQLVGEMVSSNNRLERYSGNPLRLLSETVNRDVLL